MTESDVIIRELSEEELAQGKSFAYFGWEGKEAFAFFSISEGYWEAAKILLCHMIRNAKDNALLDSLIYPLFFNYRHSVETFLKLLYFKFGEQTDKARQEYMEAGHNLFQLWRTLRPFLNKRKKHLGTKVDMNAVEHYIRTLSDFDPDSMIMRYPITKDLSGNKERVHHFDYRHFGHCMDDLCAALRQLDYDLSDQMDEAATLDELTDFLNMVERYGKEIDHFIQLLEEETKKEKDKYEKSKGGFKIFCFDDDSFLTEEPSPILRFIDGSEPDLQILLNTLCYGGRCVAHHSVRLSCSAVERQKEFVKFCNGLMENNNLQFGKTPHPSQLNIRCKVPSTLLHGLSTALSILRLE